MSYSETLEDNGKYRVRLIADEYPSEPYNDGQSPLLRIERNNYRGMTVSHVMDTGRPLDDDDRIEYAVRHWGTSPSDDDWRLFEKYLRAFYGTTKIETWHSGSYWYVTYDTAKWREYIGVTDDTSWLAKHSDSINMNEWRSYVEGDVWGYDVERNVTWRRDDDPDESMQTWESVDSCWGFYGSDYARESALEAYNYAINPEKGE